MKELFCCLLSIMCILITDCGNAKADPAINVAIGATSDSANSEADIVDDTEPEFSYDDLKQTEFWFGSGAGGWRTTMTIQKDGSFEGEYSNSDMGDVGEGYPHGTAYYCKFGGQLSELTKVDDLTYKAELIDISYENPVGGEDYIDDVRYIYSDAYGLDEADTIYFYLPGTKREKLPEECLIWVEQAMYDNNGNSLDQLNFVCLYNEAEKEAFYSYSLAEN